MIKSLKGINAFVFACVWPSVSLPESELVTMGVGHYNADKPSL